MNPENMANCKCLEMSVMDLIFIHKEIVSRWSARNACHHSFKYLFCIIILCL